MMIYKQKTKYNFEYKLIFFDILLFIEIRAQTLLHLYYFFYFRVIPTKLHETILQEKAIG